MAEMYAVSGETLTGIADAIRSASGSLERMPVDSMPALISELGGAAFITSKSHTKYQTINEELRAAIGSDCFMALNESTPMASGVFPYLIVYIHGSSVVYRRTSTGAIGFSTVDASMNTNIPAGTKFRVIPFTISV